MHLPVTKFSPEGPSAVALFSLSFSTEYHGINITPTQSILPIQPYWSIIPSLQIPSPESNPHESKRRLPFIAQTSPRVKTGSVIGLVTSSSARRG